MRVGDQNNKFFHKTVQAQNSSNAIRKIQLPTGHYTTDLDEIKSEAERFFREFLQQSPLGYTGATLEDIQELIGFRCTHETQNNLTREVSAEEIRSTLFKMPNDKSPGPDGYTVEFFKAAWSVVGADFTVAIQSFFIKGFLPKGVNSSILTLIPKKTDAVEMRDYRPISCCNVIYKVISKILANRLKKILTLFIAPNQSAFVKDRLLLENLLLASELVNGYHLETVSTRCAIKFDISKDFDSIQWSFILNTLRALHIP